MIIPQFSIEITVFLTLRSLKTVRFSKEIIFKDNLVNRGFITRHSDWLKAVLLFKKGNVFFSCHKSPSDVFCAYARYAYA